MTLRSKVASALSFAHLAGIGSQSRAEEDDKKDDDGKDKSKKAKAEDDDKKDQDHEDDAKAEEKDDDDGKDKAEDEKPDDKDDDKKDAKKAKAKADDDDSDDEMRGSSAAAAARRRERARCASIFASKFSAKNPTLAANLAFNTSMTRQEALVVLESTPVASSGAVDRQARNPALGSGGTSQGSSAQAVKSSWDRAFAQANPRRGQSK